jgi:DNA-binding PadR family transcriptional regulator
MAAIVHGNRPGTKKGLHLARDALRYIAMQLDASKNDWMFLPRGVRRAIRRGRRHHGDGPPGAGGPPFGFPPGGGLRGRRARRGDIRTALLALLVERPMHGYEMLRELEQRSGAMWKPSAGSVYPTLQLLEDEGLVKGHDVDGRRTFAITDAGKTELKSRKREREGEGMPWEDRGDDPARELREAAISVGEAAMQVARVASGEPVARALEILRDARRRLYAVLAETP